MDYHSAIKRSEVLIYTITWMNPENTTLSEEADHQNTYILYIYIYIYIHKMSKIGKSIETESKLGSYLGLLGERADRAENSGKGAGGQ